MSRRIAVMLGTFLFLILHGCAQDEGPGEREERIAGAEPWDVVILTDSYGWGVAEIYADSVEASRGVEVRLHDLAIGGLCAADALEALRGNPFQKGLIGPDRVHTNEMGQVLIAGLLPDLEYE
jgi:hypothetical protein